MTDRTHPDSGCTTGGMVEMLQPAPTTQSGSAPHPIDLTIAADLERSDWTPEEALRWYAAGKHYDTVPNGDGSSSARILDNGAVASNALKSMSREYAEHKGDVALTASQADRQPVPEYVGNGMFKGETVQKAAEHWANWCDVRCMTGLSEFLRVVAARAPADSVLEDAARLDWLALAGPTSICVVIDREYDGEVEVSTDDVTGYGKTLREALDAARKQGANHDKT